MVILSGRYIQVVGDLTCARSSNPPFFQNYEKIVSYLSAIIFSLKWLFDIERVILWWYISDYRMTKMNIIVEGYDTIFSYFWEKG